MSRRHLSPTGEQKQGSKASDEKNCWLVLNFNKAPPEPRAPMFFSTLCGGLERTAPRIMCVKLLSGITSDQLSFIVIEKISFSFFVPRRVFGSEITPDFLCWSILIRECFFVRRSETFVRAGNEFFFERQCFPSGGGEWKQSGDGKHGRSELRSKQQWGILSPRFMNVRR